MTLTARTIEAIEPGIVTRVAPPRAATGAIVPLSWLVIAAILSTLAVRLLLVRAGLSLSTGSRTFDLACLSGVVLAIFLHASCAATTGWRRTGNEFATHAALFSVFCMTGAVAAYPIAAAGHGYLDAAFSRADAALGFDWMAWYRFVAEHRWAQLLGRTAYLSIFVTPAALFAHFARTRETAEARRFLAAFWVAAVLTLASAAWLPLRGPLAGIDPAQLPYMPVSGVYQSALPPLLRLHELRLIDPLALHGLVGAPSFHTVSAVLYVAVGWRCGNLRWPLLAVNVAMLLAIPVEGTHYLIDMLMGAAVAIAALVIVDTVIAALARGRRREAEPVLRGEPARG